ncbi:MAG: MarR family winged helix-turn-helix transcriptional regulator [Bradymonadia bacterium]
MSTRDIIQRSLDDSQIVDIEDSVAYHIYRAARLLRRHFASLGTQAGIELTQEQWFVINRLRRQSGQAQSELGDDLFNDRPSLTRMLASMERRGWIERRKDPEDGRRTLVFLSEEGRAVHDQFSASIHDARGALLGDFSPEALATTYDTLVTLERKLSGQG